MPAILTSESSLILPAVAKRMGPAFFRKRFVCISTAAALYPERSWVTAEQECLKAQGATVEEVELSSLTKEEAQSIIQRSEGLFIHGGNTFFLLQEMQRVGLPELIHDYVASGRPYVGSSAGTIVAGPHIKVIATKALPSTAPSVQVDRGLNLIDVVPFVHFNNSEYWPEFRAAFGHAIELGVSVLTLCDDQFVLVEKGSMEIVTAK